MEDGQIRWNRVGRCFQPATSIEDAKKQCQEHFDLTMSETQRIESIVECTCSCHNNTPGHVLCTLCLAANAVRIVARDFHQDSMNIMLIAALSDLHGNLPVVPKSDLCIIAGDVCPVECKRPDDQQEWLETEFKDWLTWINAPLIVGVAGNHDKIFDCDRPKPYLPWKYLINSTLVHEDIAIYGTPYCKWHSGNSFMRNEHELFHFWKSSFPVCDICISHGPPHGYLDKAPNGHNCGMKELTHQLKRFKVPLAICGHIHEQYGWVQTEHTLIANVALTDNSPQKHQIFEPMLINYDPIVRKARVL